MILTERFKLSAAVVDDPNCGLETQFARTFRHGKSSFRRNCGAPQNRIDVHVESGRFCKPSQLLVQNLQAFFRNIIWRDVIDADLKVVEACSVEPQDALNIKEITIGK